MRKIKLVATLIVLMFIICGCSGSSTDSNNPFKRKHNAKDDEIKFYDFEWFIEANDILARFDKDFGKDSYEVNKENMYLPFKENTVEAYSYNITGKYKQDLLWNIDGNNISSLNLNMLTNDGGKHCYLYSVSYHLSFTANQKDIKSNLDKLYSYDEVNLCYKDKNDNYLRYQELDISYCCKDGEDIIIDNMSN